MLCTSGFSCARFGTAKDPSRQRIRIESIRARIYFLWNFAFDRRISGKYTPIPLRFVEIDGWEESKANSTPSRPALTNRGRGTLRVFVSGAIENDCLATVGRPRGSAGSQLATRGERKGKSRFRIVLMMHDSE